MQSDAHHQGARAHGQPRARAEDRGAGMSAVMNGAAAAFEEKRPPLQQPALRVPLLNISAPIPSALGKAVRVAARMQIAAWERALSRVEFEQERALQAIVRHAATTE